MMRFFIFLYLILLSGCATQSMWRSPKFSGKTVFSEKPLAAVKIYIEDAQNKKRKFVTTSDSNGNFSLDPFRQSHFCFLLGCMGDPGIAGSYVFVKAGYKETSVPYSLFGMDVMREIPPELDSRDVFLRPSEQ